MLNFIIGTAGSGKSHTLQHKLIKESINNPDSRFVLLVPDQYSLEAQKEILDKHPNHGAFNIEVSSFNRLAYEILDEQGFGEAKMMDELTKSILVRRALIDCAKELKVYGGKINMPGFTEKVKSILDEFGQYGIDEQGLKDIISLCDEKSTLKKKLEDVEVIRKAFNEYVDNLNMTSDELLNSFINVIGESEIIKNTYIYLDGFTGFTPIQEKVIAKFVEFAKDVTVTATMPVENVDDIIALAKDKGLRPEDRRAKKNELLPEDDLFNLGKNTVYHLASEVSELGEIIKLDSNNQRIKDNKALTLVSNNIFGQGTDTFDESQDSIEIHEANSLEDEVLNVVKTIAAKVSTKQYRYSDFAVITGDMENYYKYIAKLFKKYEIPVFIDYKRSTSVNLFADLIIALIRLVEYGFDYDVLFHVLRLGVTNIDQDDIDYIENYILTFRRTSFKSFSQDWKRGMKNVDMVRINKIREQIYTYFKEYMSTMTKKGATVSDYCRAIYAFLEKIDVSAQIEKYIEKFKEEEEYALADEYSQMHAALIKLLESLENSLSGEKISFEDFEKLTLSAIEELKIGIIPPGIDDVMVGDIERTRLKDIKKVIFLIGANDGIIPMVSSPATIINDSDREKLKDYGIELAPTTKDNVFKQMFYLYTIINKPTEKFVVSYSTSDKDSKPIKKSYFVDNLENLVPSIKTIKNSAKEIKVEDIINRNVAYDYLAEQGLKRRTNKQSNEEIKIYNAIEDVLKEKEETNYVLETIRKGTFHKFKDGALTNATAEEIFSDADDIKITRAQTFIDCPYKHFGKYGLCLTERDVYQLSNMESGNIEHHILENFFKKIASDGIDVKNSDEETIRKTLESCIEAEFESEELSDYFISDPAKDFTKSQLSKIAKETVDILIAHLKSSDFEVSTIESMSTGGQADRVDKFIDGENVYLKVIDYKTGDKSFKYGDLISGRDMQVFVYLKDAINNEVNNPDNEGKKIVPAGAFYFHVHNPYLDKTNADINEQRLKSYKLTGLANEDCTESIYNVGDLKDIMVSASDNSLNTEYYNKVLNHTDKMMNDAKDKIKEGTIFIDPYKGACDFCKFAGICRIETSEKGVKEVKKYKKKEVQEFLDEE